MSFLFTSVESFDFEVDEGWLMNLKKTHVDDCWSMLEEISETTSSVNINGDYMEDDEW